MLERARRRFPRNRRRNDDAEAPNRSCCGDPNHIAARIEKGSSRKAIVHRSGRSIDLVNCASRASWQRPANNRDDAGAGGDAIAPGSANGDSDVADADWRSGWGDRLQSETRCPQHGEARRWIPSEKLSGDRIAAGANHAQSILAPERAHHGEDEIIFVYQAAGGPAPAGHLDNRGCRGCNGVGNVVGKVSNHAPIIAGRRSACTTRMGG